MTNDNDYSRALTPIEVCARMRISLPTFYKMVKSGKLRAIRYGARLIRVPADEVKRLFGSASINE